MALKKKKKKHITQVFIHKHFDIVTINPLISEYFLAGLNDGGADILLSVNKNHRNKI